MKRKIKNTKNYKLTRMMLSCILLTILGFTGCSVTDSQKTQQDTNTTIEKEKLNNKEDNLSQEEEESPPTSEPKALTENITESSEKNNEQIPSSDTIELGLIETMNTEGYENLSVGEFNQRLKEYAAGHSDYIDELYEAMMSPTEEYEFTTGTLYFSICEINENPIFLTNYWLCGDSTVLIQSELSFDSEELNQLTVQARDELYRNIDQKVSVKLNDTFKSFTMEEIQNKELINQVNDMMNQIEQAEDLISTELTAVNMCVYDNAEQLIYQYIPCPPINEEAISKYTDYEYINPTENPLNICFVGNSLTYVPCIPETLERIFGTEYPNLQISEITMSGATLSQLLQSIQSVSKYSELVSNADVLILQEYGAEKDDTFESIENIKAMTKDSCKIYFYETDFDFGLNRTELADSYDFLNIIPIGTATYMLQQYGIFAYDELHVTNDYHPNNLYGYIASYIIDRVLFGDDLNEQMKNTSSDTSSEYIQDADTKDWEQIAQILEEVISMRYVMR